MRRRQLLAIAGSTLPAAIAGCTGTNPDGAEASDRDENDTDSPDDTTGSESKDDSDEESETAEETWTEPDWPRGPYAEYDTTIVEVEGDSGAVLGKVKAAVAHPGEQWSLGLSAAESLPENAGMLFESDAENDRTFWMKNMSFGLDIVYVGEDRRITSIHHAPKPAAEDTGTEQQYQFSGRAQYVFEVNQDWTTERGITQGDVLNFELES
jgi:uncharacterized membrane protein (UPF0127 family)